MRIESATAGLRGMLRIGTDVWFAGLGVAVLSVCAVSDAARHAPGVFAHLVAQGSAATPSFGSEVAGVLRHFDVPTTTELTELAGRIDRLSASIDALVGSA